MKKLALAFMAAASLVFGFGLVAQAYPPDGLTASADPSTVAPGGTVTVTVEGCADGESITITLEDSSVTATCKADVGGAFLLAMAPSSGTAVGDVTAPTTPGTYTGTASGPESGEATFTVKVVEAEDDGEPAGTLPSTGSGGLDTTLVIAIGLFIVGLGLFAVSQVRRRQSLA